MAESTGTGRIVHRVIEQEMKQAYVDYAMSVIVGRALPDARDGLKPVHRRILFAMHQSGLLHNKPFKKSAHIVGKVLAETHPHGDLAVYDALVRMAQDFSLRYPLIDGQGNWGSIDGDNAAAYRYCISGDSLLLTDKGAIPIGTLSRKEEAQISMRVLSYDGKCNPASRFFNSGKHKTIKITTKASYSLEGSYNHPILTWQVGPDFRPRIEWKLLEQLQEGDIALISRNHGLFARRPLDLRQYHPKIGFRNNIKLPGRMNNGLAFLLGALVSEGSFHNKQILFVNKDMGFYTKIKSIIRAQFPNVQLYERKIKGDCMELSIYEQKVVMFLTNIGLKQSRSDSKEIPFSVLQSKKEHLKSFLVALFEGDGGLMFITDKRHGGKSIHITYDSKSEKLIKQLKVILLNFGIVSLKPQKDRRNNCWKLYITSVDNIYKFYTEIGFFSERKQERLRKIVSINKRRLSKIDFIPFLNDYLRTTYNSHFVERNNFDRYNSLQKNYTKLIQLIEKKDKDLIDWLLENRYFFDQITTIEKNDVPKEVFSIRVDSPCHSFVANGFVNHNTEARLNALAEEMLADIEKETVDFKPNFDSSLQEPAVLPSAVPNLLVNGSSGIAVGMATNIPTHNLREVCDAIGLLIDKPEVEIDELIKIVPGPDFPTGATIVGRAGVEQAYKMGRGKVTVRAVATMEEGSIVITEIPYMVNKSQMIEEMAELVRAKRVEGIRNIRDESDREGIRVVIELKSGADSQVVLNQLYKFSRMKTTFGIIFLALVNGEPKLLTLKSALEEYINHRRIVVRRRTQFELNKAEEKAHLLEGLIVALDHVDDVVDGIRASKTVEDAKMFLVGSYQLSDVQAKAILEMKLQRLASLEQQSIRDEHQGLLVTIAELKSILASEQSILNIIKKEVLGLKEKFGDERRTRIVEGEEREVEVEELIEEKEMVITITHDGYIKRLELDAYRRQRRGGRGVVAAGAKEEDWVEDLFVASTHSSVLFFTNKGQVHWLKVHKIPEGGRQAKGKPIVNLLSLAEGEKISSFVPVMAFEAGKYLFMATKKGTVKKTPLDAFSRPRAGGIRAITLDDGDELIGVELTTEGRQIILATRDGTAIRFDENDVRPMGRAAGGVRGISLEQGDDVVGMEVADESKTLLTVTDKGFGKRTAISEYRLISRGGKGVINITLTEKTGKVVGVKAVDGDDELMFISKNGIAIRTASKDVSVIGRATQGVRVMRLENGDELVAVERIVKEESGNGDNAPAA